MTGLSYRDTRYTPGSIVDAAILGQTAVLFELKITGQIEHAQLVRHARHWSLDLPAHAGPERDRPLGDGFALRTWQDVRGWVGRELQRDDLGASDRRRIAQFADTLVRAGLGSPDAALEPPRSPNRSRSITRRPLPRA